MKRQSIEVIIVMATKKAIGGRLGYAIARKVPDLRKAAKEVAERADPKEAYTEAVRSFIEGKNNLIEKHAKKDKSGNPIMVEPGKYRIEDAGALEAALKEYDEKHRDVKAAFEAQDKALKDYLDEELPFEKWKGQLSWLPGFQKEGEDPIKDPGLTPEEIEAIMEIVDLEEGK